MEYSIIDIVPATIACISFKALKKIFLKPDVSCGHFFCIIKSVTGINNQALTTKPNIKGITIPCSYDHIRSFPFYFTL